MQFINREFIIAWNAIYPLDRWWRKKYGISFNTPEHRAVSYIDIYYEWLEDQMFEELFVKEGEEAQKREQYEKTKKWLVLTSNEQETKSEEEQKLIDMFENMNPAAFDNDG